MKRKAVKYSYYLLIISLIMQLVPGLADASEVRSFGEAVLINDDVGAEIVLYEDEELEAEIARIPDLSEVTILKDDQPVALISYLNDSIIESEETLVGF